MNLDQNIYESNSKRFAKNIMIGKSFNTISNEYGFSEEREFNETVIGIIPTPDNLVIFSTNNTISEIGTYDGTTYNTIIRSIHLNFHLSSPIRGESKYNAKGEVIVVWCNGNEDTSTFPYLLNINSLPFDLDSNKELINPSLISNIYLFPDVSLPVIDLDSIQEGGNLYTGIYYIITSYELEGKKKSNWSRPYGPYYIVETQKDKSNYTSVRNKDKVAIISDHSIKINITEIDQRYERLHIGVIYKDDAGVLSSYQYATIKITGSTEIFSITNNNKINTISTDEYSIPSFSCERIHDMTSFKDELLICNYTTSEIIDYQKYANNIQVKWVAKELDNVDDYKELTICSKYKTLQPNEVYSLNIHFELNDGSISQGFHIPGRANSSIDDNGTTRNENDLISLFSNSITTRERTISDNARYFQIRDTSDKQTISPVGLVGRGNMGLWENQNETYPDTDDFEVWDSSGNIGSPIKNQKVRHHKTPSLKTIYNGDSSFVATECKVIIGIELVDVYIPTDIENKVKGFFISYGIRTLDNSTVLSSGIAERENTDNYYRYYDFALLSQKTGIAPRYLNFSYLKSTSSNNNLIDDFGPISTDNISFVALIDDWRYLPSDNSATEPSNEDREECLYLDSPHTSNYNAGTGEYFVSDLMKYVEDIYTQFTDQQVSFTNTVFKTDGSNQYATNGTYIYGFDSFICHMHINRTGTNGGKPDQNVRVYTPFNHYFQSYEEIVESNSTDTDQKLMDMVRSYNLTYSSINNLIQTGNYNTYDEITNLFPYRIQRSLTSQDDGLIENWRTFRVEDYHESIRSKGPIYSLSANDETVVVQFKYSMATTSIKDKIENENDTAYLGVGDIFDRPLDEKLPAKNGYVGCQSLWGTIIFPGRYLVVDRQQGKIFFYNFGNGSFLEISKNGIEHWCRRNLTSTIEEDNPFTGNGITVGYDDDYNRVIISKSESNSKSFTLSYHLDHEQWVCLHDYLPNVLIYNKLGLYSINNNTEANTYKLYRHNDESKVGIYYNTNPVASYVDIVFNFNREDLNIHSISWISEILNFDKTKELNKTFTHIMLYNDINCTDLVEIKTDHWHLSNTSKVKNVWQFNFIYNNVISSNNVIIDDDGNINSSNLSQNISWYKKNNFDGKVAIVRFFYDNVEQKNIYLNDYWLTYLRSIR